MWHWVGSLPREGVVGTHGDHEGVSKCDGPQESCSIGRTRQCEPRDFITSNDLGVEQTLLYSPPSLCIGVCNKSRNTGVQLPTLPRSQHTGTSPLFSPWETPGCSNGGREGGRGGSENSMPADCFTQDSRYKQVFVLVIKPKALGTLAKCPTIELSAVQCRKNFISVWVFKMSETPASGQLQPAGLTFSAV